MVHRIYVERKTPWAVEAASVFREAQTFLGMEALKGVRLLHRYDIEGLDEALLKRCRAEVLGDPVLDWVTEEMPNDADVQFATALLPGQFDQRADSAEACIQLISGEERPTVRCATVWLLYGSLPAEEIQRFKRYYINPVESEEVSLDVPETLQAPQEAAEPVPTVDGFRSLPDAQLEPFLEEYGLAMSKADLALCREYFSAQHRDPTETELRAIDTYWSDHCRHTTFHTAIESVEWCDADAQKAFADYETMRRELGRTGPPTLMDLATIYARYLKRNGRLPGLDESEEVNACTVKIEVEVEGEREDWLLFFKNETHNHPTEIEPYGGAATCLGGAIRDPLSGRGYVYAAMRVSGAADPRTSFEDTLEGKLSQRTIVRKAADGYRTYGHQIGVAAGRVDEWYHPGFVAKRLEAGAVVGAAPARNVVRKEPVPGDVVLLVGGRTGRDGLGGATGSSKSHSVTSQKTGGSEVQRGNAPEERNIQRLFLRGEATRLIKRCNDFGAGGVSVAVGELAPGVQVDLNAVPVKYAGLDGTDLALSESQERMAVVVAAPDVDAFCALAASENVEATPIARIAERPALIMEWNGQTVACIDRAFLDSNGAPRSVHARVEIPQPYERSVDDDFAEAMRSLVRDLNVCSGRGLAEQFDASACAGTVLAPFGGATRRTPSQAMVHKVFDPVRDVKTCSLMAWGYNPFIMEQNPFRGAYAAVVESAAKLIASGADFSDMYFSFQEYFERLEQDAARWGKPLAALLGAFAAQRDLGVAAIGGKDSMSGTFEHLHVPPSFLSFAVSTAHIDDICSPEFKRADRSVYWVCPRSGDDGEAIVSTFRTIADWKKRGYIAAAMTPGYGGAAEAVYKMALGNELGFAYESGWSLQDLFGYAYGSFIIEADYLPDDVPDDVEVRLLGRVLAEPFLVRDGVRISVDELAEASESVLASVYPSAPEDQEQGLPNLKVECSTSMPGIPKVKAVQPGVCIPVLWGTTGEFDALKKIYRAGGRPDVVTILNRSPQAVRDSVERLADAIRKAHILWIPGGAHGGDEPDGVGKWVSTLLRQPAVKEAIEDLIEHRDGLILGTGSGFNALLRLGLLPHGVFQDPGTSALALAHNESGRYRCDVAHIRIASNRSPWLSMLDVGEVYRVPVACSEGRLVGPEQELGKLASAGQIATQFCDERGDASMRFPHNPTGSMRAAESLISPDGRILGTVGLFERWSEGLFQNVPGEYDLKLFESAVAYYR